MNQSVACFFLKGKNPEEVSDLVGSSFFCQDAQVMIKEHETQIRFVWVLTYCCFLDATEFMLFCSFHHFRWPALLIEHDWKHMNKKTFMIHQIHPPTKLHQMNKCQRFYHSILLHLLEICGLFLGWGEAHRWVPREEIRNRTGQQWCHKALDGMDG